MRLRRPDLSGLRRAAVAALLSACGGVDDAPAMPCDPLADTGCAAGEHCRVRENGRTLCLTPETAVEAQCTPGSCAPGEACARVEGYLACRPLCPLDTETCPEPAVCRYALNETYGLCVSPCEPFPSTSVEACPGGACAPTLSLPFSVCVGLGPGRLGEDCHTQRCGRALACLSADDGVLCRALCTLGEDSLCPPPQICSGEVAERALGYCRPPDRDALR